MEEVQTTGSEALRESDCRRSRSRPSKKRDGNPKKAESRAYGGSLGTARISRFRFAHPRTHGSRFLGIRTTRWETLSQVDWVLAVSVDDRDWPKFANVHMIPAEELRERFDRAYAARNAYAASNPDRKKVPLDRSMWLSLYHQESKDPVTHVGAGVGLEYPPIDKVPLEPTTETKTVGAGTDDSPLTIAEAKRGLAKIFGVDPASIKITVEG